IAVAVDAAYNERSLRNTVTQLREKYFRFDGNTMRVRPEVRELVRFRQLNLFDDSAMEAIRQVDIIWCCNVLIYFDLAFKKRVLEHLSSSLLDGGYLLLGQAESLFRISDQFQLVHLPSATAYRKITNISEVRWRLRTRNWFINSSPHGSSPHCPRCSFRCSRIWSVHSIRRTCTRSLASSLRTNPWPHAACRWRILPCSVRRVRLTASRRLSSHSWSAFIKSRSRARF